MNQRWNYRMTRETLRDPNATGPETRFAIRKVYYGEQDDEVRDWSKEPVWPSAETWNEMAEDLTFYGEAVANPVLDIDTGTWLEPGGVSEPS